MKTNSVTSMSSKRVEITKPRRTPQEIEENKKWTRKKLLEILDCLHNDLLDLVHLPVADREIDRRLYELYKYMSKEPQKISRIFNQDAIINGNKFKLYRELFDEDEKHFKYGIDYKKLWKIVKWKLLRDLAEEGIRPKEKKEESDSEDSESSEEEDWSLRWLRNTEDWLIDYVRDGIFYK